MFTHNPANSDNEYTGMDAPTSRGVATEGVKAAHCGRMNAFSLDWHQLWTGDFFFFFGKRFIHVVTHVPLSTKKNCKVAGDSQDQHYQTRCSQSGRPGACRGQVDR